MLAPPQIVTPGHLPELLYEAKQPFASDVTQQLAWVKMLQETGPAELAPLIARLPERDDFPTWLALGQMLSELHRELAADGLDCQQVLDTAAQCDGFNESRRWALLCELEQRDLRSLDELQVWDKQTARLFAIRHRECRAERRIVLIGLVDLNRAQRQMLDQVATQVTALVLCPMAKVVAEFVRIPTVHATEFSRIPLRIREASYLTSMAASDRSNGATSCCRWATDRSRSPMGRATKLNPSFAPSLRSAANTPPSKSRSAFPTSSLFRSSASGWKSRTCRPATSAARRFLDRDHASC